jgi:predicted lysophospholipase L1 biosynthesis ABC-type transport system permease subunit
MASPGRARVLVLALCGAALCVLLLACANLASLFLARGAFRAHELAVRSALGAGRERLVRQLVTESLGVALVGGLVGVAAAAVLLPLLSLLVPSTLPVAERATLDLRALALAASFTLATGFAFGLVPALRAAGASAMTALRADSRTGGGRTQRIRAALVVVEVAASVVLLVTSGLLIRAVWRIQSADLGVRSRARAGLAHGAAEWTLRHHRAAPSVLRSRARATARGARRQECGVCHRPADVHARRDLDREGPREGAGPRGRRWREPALRDLPILRHAGCADQARA